MYLVVYEWEFRTIFRERIELTIMIIVVLVKIDKLKCVHDVKKVRGMRKHMPGYSVKLYRLSCDNMDERMRGGLNLEKK